MAANKKSGGSEKSTNTDTVLDPLTRAGKKAADNSATISLKMIDHAEANSRDAFEAMRAAARADSLAEVLRIQGEYIREQGSRNMTLAREVGELIVQMGKDTLQSGGKN